MSEYERLTKAELAESIALLAMIAIAVLSFIYAVLGGLIKV